MPRIDVLRENGAMGDDKLLHIYLNDHLAGHIVGRELAKRCRGSNRDSALGEYLDTFLQQVKGEGDVLQDVMDRVGARRDPVKLVAAWAAERVGRLKGNGRLIGYSDLSRLEEVEGLCLGVEGKVALWRTLQRLAESDERLEGIDFVRLERRGRAQRAELEELRMLAAATALAA
jgi:hypothetical protein